jgi:hypothetical protein
MGGKKFRRNDISFLNHTHTVKHEIVIHYHLALAIRAILSVKVTDLDHTATGLRSYFNF